MKRTLILAFAVFMLLAVPAMTADYKISGTFFGGYSYANGKGEDKLGLTLALDFNEAGLLSAHVPLILIGGIGVDTGWWVKYATIPLNVIISDNSAAGYKWVPIETTFGMLSQGTSSNRYSRVWGDLTPMLNYTAEASMDDITGFYSIAAQLGIGLPAGLTLTSNFGWLHNADGYNMGLSTALTGAIPVIGGTFKVAVGNFADLDLVLIPPVNFWDTDDLQAFAVYVGVHAIELGGPITLSEISYKMSMPGVYDGLFSSSSFYTLDLQEVTTNFLVTLDPVTILFKNGLWFRSFNSLGGNNANLDVAVRIGALTLGLNIDSKLNWVSGLKHAEYVKLRADFSGGFGIVGGTLGYNSNWDGVGKYEVNPSYGSDSAHATLYYDSPFGLSLEAYGDYEQFGTNTAMAGIYAEYVNTCTAVPYVIELKGLIAGSFDYEWEEPNTNSFGAIGMLKLDTKINAFWDAGLMFITRNASSPYLSFEPMASIYAKYRPTDMVTVNGTVTYRRTPGELIENNYYAKLQGDIKVSANATASVYWGASGLKSVSSGDSEYARPWGPYFAEVGPMYWDTFGAEFLIKF